MWDESHLVAICTQNLDIPVWNQRNLVDRIPSINLVVKWNRGRLAPVRHVGASRDSGVPLQVGTAWRCLSWKVLWAAEFVSWKGAICQKGSAHHTATWTYGMLRQVETGLVVRFAKGQAAVEKCWKHSLMGI